MFVELTLQNHNRAKSSNLEKDVRQINKKVNNSTGPLKTCKEDTQLKSEEHV